MATETPLLHSIMLAIGKHAKAVRVFRNNTGTGWVGEMARKGSILIIKNPRPLQAGLCEGSSDLIGWTTTKVTADMIGQEIAIFTAIEVKTPTGRVSDEQRNFIERVKQAGGIAGTVRSENDAIELLKR